MHIAIDFSAVASTGTLVYAAGFLPALSRLGGEHRFTVLAPPRVRQLWNPGEASSIIFRDIPEMPASVRIGWQQVVLPRHLSSIQCDVLFAPFDIAPLRSPCPTVLAVRNPMPTVIHQGTRGIRRTSARNELQYWLSRWSCRWARTVFYPTAYASNLLGDAMHVPASKRRVVFHGTDQSFWTIRARSEELDERVRGRRFILFVSRLYPQKQPDLLVRAFADLLRCPGMSDLSLVIAGSAVHNGQLAELRALTADLRVMDQVHLLGGVSRHAVRALYQNAVVFVLPSLMETFGHPYVEAMASGVPVIAADTAFARELCGDAAEYFTPADDHEALRARLATVLASQQRATQMRQAGIRRASVFSWDREARETLALLTDGQSLTGVISPEAS